MHDKPETRTDHDGGRSRCTIGGAAWSRVRQRWTRARSTGPPRAATGRGRLEILRLDEERSEDDKDTEEVGSTDTLKGRDLKRPRSIRGSASCAGGEQHHADNEAVMIERAGSQACRSRRSLRPWITARTTMSERVDADEVGPPADRIAIFGQEPRTEDEHQGHDGNHQEEHRSPPEIFEGHAGLARRPDRAADGIAGAPHADGEGPLSGVVKHIADEREGRRRDRRPRQPRRARAAISMPALWAKAASTEAAPNAAAPTRSNRRRPKRSPRLPMVMSEPATRKP